MQQKLGLYYKDLKFKRKEIIYILLKIRNNHNKNSLLKIIDFGVSYGEIYFCQKKKWIFFKYHKTCQIFFEKFVKYNFSIHMMIQQFQIWIKKLWEICRKHHYYVHESKVFEMLWWKIWFFKKQISFFFCLAFRAVWGFYF